MVVSFAVSQRPLGSAKLSAMIMSLRSAAQVPLGCNPDRLERNRRIRPQIGLHGTLVVDLVEDFARGLRGRKSLLEVQSADARVYGVGCRDRRSCCVTLLLFDRHVLLPGQSTNPKSPGFQVLSNQGCSGATSGTGCSTFCPAWSAPSCLPGRRAPWARTTLSPSRRRRSSGGRVLSRPASAWSVSRTERCWLS